MDNKSLSSAKDANDRLGWTASPNGRGTMNIIWSCGLTTFLCCWSVLIVNLPEPGTSRRSIIMRKALLLGLCAAAPEAIFQVALGQWLSAYNSVEMFHASGHRDWTVRHGFWADMGGLHLRSSDYPSFPINSRQLHYLIAKGYVAYPRVEENQIRDRNKVDGTLRFITLIQTLFFIVNISVRAAQHLAITALELSTAAFVVLSVLTTGFWFRKPADVQRCEFVETEVSISTILSNENVTANTAYTYTPLDFVGRKEWSWSVLWMHGLNCLRRFHLAGQPQQLPTQRFQNTLVPEVQGWFLAFFATLSLAYFGIFVAGWNYSFPTSVEQILWRSASLTVLITASGVFIFQQVFFEWCLSWRQRSNHAQPSSETGEGAPDRQTKHGKNIFAGARALRSRINHFISLVRNNSVSKDPALDAPARAIFITWFFGFFYVSGRSYIIIADFVELRSLPKSAYETVNWAWLAAYVP